MPNLDGFNGRDNGTQPPDGELPAELLQYTKERLPLDRRLDRLKKKFGYIIGTTHIVSNIIRTTKLKKLNKKFDIPSARWPLPLPVATAVVCDAIATDVHKRNGPDTVMRIISSQGKYAIPRSITRAIMRDNDPLGFEVRYHASRAPIPRGVLTAKGLNHEGSADGHEKFSSMALQMGPVGFGIYAFREKLSGCILHGAVVPNVRKASTIGHVYLDMVSVHGCIFCQLTVDHGSETGDMYAAHAALRRLYAPELDETEWKLFVAITSTHNVCIENIWMRWLKTSGRNVQSIILQGKTNSLFNPLDEVDMYVILLIIDTVEMLIKSLFSNLFQWLWPQIVQIEFDKFMDYWNCH
ncbi:hypothetical protein GSI_10382 [Ganoderma sinense ZZ0214-1]|uniref:Uncharacterized protein n=1 Tax=Ganoderma sinense ZZ0214-1 TaxID=1077348 RepID=A0A2G8S109_9APHY|nr:hypothetical protein GSI_10382 [Ganoderma sinense ZZ0214-1]